MALVGHDVVLSGLKREELNGARGIAVSYDAGRDRYGVSGITPGGDIAIKAENLAPAPESEPEPEEPATVYTEPDGDELLECARYGEVPELEQLLKIGTPIDFADDSGNTALHKAAANGHVEAVEALVREGARHVPNSSGNTPLHWATQQGQLEAVKALLRLFPAADVLAQNSFGRSASTEAFGRGDHALVDAILQHPSAAELEKGGGGGGGGKCEFDELSAEETHNFSFGGVPVHMLCYAMLCYAMLRYAMLCYAMLCHAMPCAGARAGARVAWRGHADADSGRVGVGRSHRPAAVVGGGRALAMACGPPWFHRRAGRVRAGRGLRLVRHRGRSRVRRAICAANGLGGRSRDSNRACAASLHRAHT